MPKIPSYHPPWFVVVSALMVCIMGVFYLVAEHMTGAIDQTFHDAFVTCLTLLAGSIVIGRAKNGGNGT